MANFNVPNKTSATYALNNFTTDTCGSTNALGTGVPMSPYTVYSYTPVIYGATALAPATTGTIIGGNYIWPLTGVGAVTGITVPVVALDSMRCLTFTTTVGAITAGGNIQIKSFDDRFVAVTENITIVVSSAIAVYVSRKAHKYIQSIVFSGTPIGATGSISIGVSNTYFGSPYLLNSVTTGDFVISSTLGSLSSVGFGYNFYTAPPSAVAQAATINPIPNDNVSGADARGLFALTQALVNGDGYRIEYYAQGADSFIQAQLNANPVSFTATGQPVYPVERNQYQSQVMQVLAPTTVNTAWTGLNLYQPSSSYLGGVNTLSSFDIYGVQYPGDTKAYNDLGAETSGFPGNTFSPMV